MSDPIAERYGLKGKVAAITGGADGIGKATARFLSSAGVSVAILDRDGPKGVELAQAILDAGGEAIPLIVDVTSEPQIEAAFAAIRDRHGRLDILVNNAGLAVRSPPSTSRWRTGNAYWRLT